MIFNADLHYYFYLEPVLKKLAANQAGWEVWGPLLDWGHQPQELKDPDARLGGTSG